MEADNGDEPEIFILSDIINRQKNKTDQPLKHKAQDLHRHVEINHNFSKQNNSYDKGQAKQIVKGQKSEMKLQQKCVRIAPLSTKVIDVNNFNHLHTAATSRQIDICSIKQINEGNECSIGEMQINVSEANVLEQSNQKSCKNANRNSKNRAMKKARSNREVGSEECGRQQKSILKSSKSIKFNQKKDVFTYKTEIQGKEETKKDGKSCSNKSIKPERQSQECCTIM